MLLVVVTGLPGLLITAGLAALTLAILLSVRRNSGRPARSHKLVAAVALAGLLSVTTGLALADPSNGNRTSVAAAPSPTALMPSDPASAPASASATAPMSPSSSSREPTARPTGPSTSRPEPQPERGTALYSLAGLSVKGRAPKTGYNRDLFGAGWIDTNHNSCTTREDILRRDLRPVTVRAGTNGCDVIRGTLADPYTGTTIRFRQGKATSMDVQVDHIVALSDAWQKGAQQWLPSKRIAFANSNLELLATDGPTNGAKSGSDAASWLPPHKPYRCTYVARQISIKAHFGLWVTAPEKAAMQRVLAQCPNQKITTSAATAKRKARSATEEEPKHQPQPEPRQEPEPQPEPKPPSDEPDSSVHYENCAAVRAAGAAPIRASDPGYSRKLDRDGDGIGCEP